MASVLFGAQAALAVLPLMLFHQMQLMVCAVLAKRRSRDAGAVAFPGDAGGHRLVDHGQFGQEPPAERDQFVALLGRIADPDAPCD